MSLRSLVGWWCVWLLMVTAQAQTTFSFIQVTDIHVPHADSVAFVRSLKNLGPLASDPSATAVPAFVIATGDLTEFGGGWWQEYHAATQETGLTWYHAAGNHDNTWYNIRPELKKLHGNAYYSFDYQGCHFIILDSATPQDPLPSFGREEVVWLTEDLAKLRPETPIFVFFHHPLGGSEFISTYEQLRIVEPLQAYNLIVIVTGHAHRPQRKDFEGFPVIIGGQGYSDLAGYTLFTVKDDHLRVAYRKMNDPDVTLPLFEKKLTARAVAATLEITDHRVISQNGQRTLELQYEYHGPAIAAMRLRIDDKLTARPADMGSQGLLTADIGSLLPGRHFATLAVEPTGLPKIVRSLVFEIKDDRKRWEIQLGGSFKAGPVAGDQRLFVAGADGKLYCLDKFCGKILWNFDTGDAVLGQVLLAGDQVIAATTGGKVFSLQADGTLAWVSAIGVPVYAHPVIAADKLIVCGRDGRVIALAAADGRQLWQKQDATYTIESRPIVYEGDLYLGAWDGHIYRYRLSDGTLISKIKGVGSSTNAAARYYSPADCGPLVAQGKLYVTDRAYLLGSWNVSDSQPLANWSKVAAMTLAADGQALYLRKTSGELSKMTLDGTVIWTTPNLGDAVPTPPSEYQGRVYLCSAGGRLSVVDAATGKLLWQYQITPGLRVYGEVAADSSGCYVADMDGTVTALAND